MDVTKEFEGDYRIVMHTFNYWFRCKHCPQMFQYKCYCGPSERQKEILRAHAQSHEGQAQGEKEDSDNGRSA